VKHDEALISLVKERYRDQVKEAVTIPAKMERYAALDALTEQAIAALIEEYPEGKGDIKEAFHDLEREILRGMILNDGKRIDGRDFTEVRPISCEVGILPRAHGSAIFTRGETQVLGIATLGTSYDDQRLDAVIGDSSKTFMLHYNFPPYCVGEVKMLRAPGRREIGHGALAERTIKAVVPDQEAFPYTHSRGVRGVGIQWFVEHGHGLLRHHGAYGCRRAAEGSGGRRGHGAGDGRRPGGRTDRYPGRRGSPRRHGLQNHRLPRGRDRRTDGHQDRRRHSRNHEPRLEQARTGRLHILDEMAKAIDKPRSEVSQYAPKMTSIQINPERIKDIIGPGGKTIKAIQADTETRLEVEDSGKVNIYAPHDDAAQAAIKAIKRLTQEPEVDQVYLGKVVKVMDFGAFVEILPGTDGLVHISQLANERVQRVTDVVNEGDEILVKVLGIDKQGKIRLSRKAVLESGEDADAK
jgi:polyribonucleotide nucleotidyltransferase